MGIKTKLLINQEKYSFDNTDWVFRIDFVDLNETIFSDSEVEKTLTEWVDYINSTLTSTYLTSFDIKTKEFSEIVVPQISRLITINRHFAYYIGLTDTNGDGYFYPTASEIVTGTLWGSHRLILQGALTTKDTQSIYSRVMMPERIENTQYNETFESIDYVINSYDSSFDLKRWLINIRWYPKNKESDVKLFFDSITKNGKNGTVCFCGDNFLINDDESYKLLMSYYKGFTVDVGHSLLFKFQIALREVI